MTTEVDTLPQEVPAEEEPRYLRRQKPVEIRRRKFGKRSWPAYRRALAFGVVVVAASFLIYTIASFFLSSPYVRLSDSAQIELFGNKYIAREAALAPFAHDLDRSVFRIPLDTRQTQLAELSWVDHAIVSRIWPNRIRVEIVERVPIAYLRTGADLSLIDSHGVILDRPLESNFQFPVVSGISESVPRSEREQRMALYSGLVHEMDQVRPGASDHLSEVDLSDSDDVRATLAGLSQMNISGVDDQGPIVVHFGDVDFGSKFRVLVENIGQWRAAAGRVESVDLRFSKQVVVNPESHLSAAVARRH
jgi:cell division protein FtsQ